VHCIVVQHDCPYASACRVAGHGIGCADLGTWFDRWDEWPHVVFGFQLGCSFGLRQCITRRIMAMHGREVERGVAMLRNMV